MRSLLALLILLPALTPPSLVAQPPLVIAVEDDAAPWSQRDGSGYANDVVLAAYKAVGIPVQLEVLPYARCKDYVLRGKVAVGFSMSWLEEFRAKILFSAEPLFICHDDFFFKNGSPLLRLPAGQLPPGTLTGVVIGYEYPPAIYALRDKGIIRFDESESEELNLKKLALGRLDSALINYNETKPAELRLAAAGVHGKVTLGARGGLLKGYVGFSLQHPQGRWAKAQFDRGRRLIAADGTLQRITALWVAKAQKETATLLDKTRVAQ